MSWFYQKKRMFLIRLLQALGFGSVIAYSICSCDSKPNADQTNKPESQAVPNAPKIEPSQDAAPQNAAAPNSDSPADAPPQNAAALNADSPADAAPQNAAVPNADSPADANANTQNAGNAADPNAESASDDAQNANNAIPECNEGDCDIEKKSMCRDGKWFSCGAGTCNNGECFKTAAIRPTKYRALIPDSFPKPKNNIFVDKPKTKPKPKERPTK